MKVYPMLGVGAAAAGSVLLGYLWLSGTEPRTPEVVILDIPPVNQHRPPKVPRASMPTVEADMASADVGTPAGSNPDYPTLEARVSEMQARRAGHTFDPEFVLASMEKAAAWEEDVDVAAGLELSDEHRYDGRRFVRLDPLKIETLMPGDALEIPVFQERNTFNMTVSEVEAYNDDVVTWHGELTEFDTLNQVTITQTPGLTLIGINTPHGIYSMRVVGDKGWIMEGGKLFRGVSYHDHDHGAAGVPH